MIINKVKRYLIKLLLVTTLFSYSCIGTDILDIEIFDPEVRIVSQVLSMELDTDYQFMASYFNEFGNHLQVVFDDPVLHRPQLLE